MARILGLACPAVAQMFSCLRDAFGPMDYQPQVVVKKDAHGHKKPVQEFVFNSYQNSIDNAAQVPRLVRCAELPVCADYSTTACAWRLCYSRLCTES